MSKAAMTLLSLWVILGQAAGAKAARQVVQEPAASTEVASAQMLLNEANDWYARRDTDGAVDKAIALYLKLLSREPRNYEVLWRLARSYWWQGDHVAQHKAEIFDAGRAAAERAIQVSPGLAEGHFWSGVCLGRASEVRGVLNSLFAIEPIRQAMETTLKIDPQYHGAMHVLGVLYRKAPGWPLSLGDMDKSLEYARQAVRLAPNEVLPYIGLAETLSAKGQKEEAKKILEKALTVTGPFDQQPETKEDKQTAKHLLVSLQSQ